MQFHPLMPMETYVADVRQHSVSLDTYPTGIHSTPHAFFRKEADGTVPWVVSRICDHAGGILRLCRDNPHKALCPMHNWEFDFDTLSYSKMPNQRFVHLEKTSLPFSVKNEQLTYSVEEKATRIPDALQRMTQSKTKAHIRFITHASIALTLDDIRFVTDPWFVGECFSCGWWLQQPPKQDAWDILDQADFLYISHNHPDHMHRETLKHVQKDKPIIVPKFATESVSNPLRHMGFTHVIELEPLQLHQVNGSDMLVCILPTGDHRDDSALFVSKGDFSALFTVDCVAANHYILPRDITALFTNFASGASGWPLCFDVIGSMEERDRIVAQNRGNAVTEVMKYISLTQPVIYMPYAGYFQEKAPRDAMILNHNIKNTPEDIVKKVNIRFPEVKSINPLEHDLVEYCDENIDIFQSEKLQLYTVDSDYIDTYLNKQKKRLELFDVHKVADYFCQSEFQDELFVYLSLTDDGFNPVGEGLYIDFSASPIRYDTVSSAELEKRFHSLSELGGKHHLLIKARKDSLWNIVYYGLPLEELSIGFQCRINRKPDQYNAAFWKHYTIHGAPDLKRGEDKLLYKLLEGAEEP